LAAKTGNKTTQFLDSLASTRELMEAYVDSYVPNSTYKTKPEVKEYMNLPYVKGFLHALACNQRYYFVGPAGIGKTSFIKAVCQALGLDAIVINAANLSIENLFVPFPIHSEELDQQVLETLFFHRFAADTQKVIFIDEIGRADAGLANTLMELLQEGTLAGREIPGLVTVVAADNPQGTAYGRMAGLDFSQADRFATVKLDAKSTPWRRALASEFADIDLSKVFSTYDTLDGNVREVLNPRVLAFVIRALTNGFPGEWALPMVTGVRMKLANRNGEDVTDVTLDKVAAALGTVNRKHIPDAVDRVVDYALAFNQNVYIQGRPGIGKTSRIKALLKAKEIAFHYDSAAVLQPEDLSVPFPSKDGKTLDLVPTAKFSTTVPWVWIVDEIARGSRRTQNAIMEPIQERTIGGQETMLKCTIALNNPREVAGFKLDVGKNDLAQASRFALSIEIDAQDIPSASYLRDVYGDEIATPFIEWWEDDLDDIGRVLCTPRALERMISLYEAGNDLQWGLPFVAGDYVKVPLVELHARLDKRPLARLKQIVAGVEMYADELAKGKDEAAMEHATVFMAFYKADIAQLTEVRDVCVRLYRLLDRQHRIDLIRQGGDRQKFWNSVLLDSDNA
jgi:MoxR-like ATPase